jgi:serine/threonine protein kinase/Tfp pilus assembly protein PilF
MICRKCGFDNVDESCFCSKCGSDLLKRSDSSSLGSSKIPNIKSEFDFNPDDLFADRYQIINEILLAREISHENVLRIHDFGEKDDIKFISMQYIEGESLKDIIQESPSPLNIDSILSISTQILEGLGAAHRNGVAHRDLKPSNIMIDENGRVYITDFGLAKSIREGDPSFTGTLVGTPQYISPEQWRGNKIDGRSDIYSFGIMMYEMVAGSLPFESETDFGYLKKHINERPKFPKDMEMGIPLFIRKIILKCLEKKTERRYMNAEEILYDLNEGKFTTKPIDIFKINNKGFKLILFVGLIILLTISFYFIKKGGLLNKKISNIDLKPSVAVMHFENNTGEKNLDQWSRAFSDLLVTDIAQSKYIRVLPEDQLYQILKEANHLKDTRYGPDIIEKVVSKANVQYIILGSYAKAGDIFRVSIKILEPKKGELLDTVYVDGKGEASLFSVVDRLTLKIKSSLSLTPKEILNDIDREIGKITTNSPEALKYYVESESCYIEQEFNESINNLKKAVAIDPEFAVAYNKISVNYSYLRQSDFALQYIKRAMDLSDRVSDRERYLIKGSYYTQIGKSYKEKIKPYLDLLKIYPEDEKGNVLLGSNYRNVEEWDLAIRQFEKVLKINDKSRIALWNLAYLFMRKGWYNKDIDFLKKNKCLLYNRVRYHRYLSDIYTCQHRYDMSLMELQNVISLEANNYKNFELIGNVYHLKGDLTEAQKIYEQLIEIEKRDSDSELLARFWIAHLCLIHGQYEKSKENIIKGVALSKESGLGYHELNLKQALEKAIKYNSKEDQINAYHLLGLNLIEVDKIDEAKKFTEELKKIIEKIGSKRGFRCYYHLMGLIAFKEDNVLESLSYIKKAINSLPYQSDMDDEHAFFIFTLASMYYKTGNIEDALHEYKRIVNLSFGRLRFGDIYSKSFYWLAKIYQKKVWKGKAIENFEKFILLWKEADSWHNELKDAKKQLITLKRATSV